jgi:hypothetical protein
MPGVADEQGAAQACLSGTRGRPSTSFGSGSGSNGSFERHRSSEAMHGRD